MTLINFLWKQWTDSWISWRGNNCYTIVNLHLIWWNSRTAFAHLHWIIREINYWCFKQKHLFLRSIEESFNLSDESCGPNPGIVRKKKIAIGVIFSLSKDEDENNKFNEFFFSHFPLFESHMNKLKSAIEQVSVVLCTLFLFFTLHFILFIKSYVYSIGKILTAVLKPCSIFQELLANSVLLKKFTILDKGLRQLIYSGTKRQL